MLRPSHDLGNGKPVSSWLDRAGKLVSYELGFITYRRLEDAQCRTTLPPASP